MAFGFKNDKNKASIRTVVLTRTRPSLQGGEVDFSFPIESDEIILALAFTTPDDDYRLHYISDFDEDTPNDSVKILRAYHNLAEGNFHVSCYVIGTMPGENPAVTIKAVLMQID